MNGGWKIRTAALAIAAVGLLASACGDTTAVAPAYAPAGPSPAVVALDPTAGDPYHDAATSAPASTPSASTASASSAPADATPYTPAD